MAIVPNDTRFIGINPTVDLRERRSTRINRETQPHTMQDITDSIRPYKVYTALLIQSGVSSFELAIDVSLVTGITYEIIDNDDSTADFTNVGAPNNTPGTFFVATGTTPNSWGNNSLGQLRYDLGAPVAIVLENTIGNIYFTYKEVGSYKIMSDEFLFIQDKTWFNQIFFKKMPTDEGELFYNNTESLAIVTFYEGILSDNVLAGDNYGNIEIRVYN
jgi:hypothetical protein